MSWSQLAQLIRNYEHRPQIWRQYFYACNTQREFVEDLDVAVRNSNQEDIKQTWFHMIGIYRELKPLYDSLNLLGISESDDRYKELKLNIEFLEAMLKYFESIN